MSGDSQGWRQRPIATEKSDSESSSEEGADFDPAEAYLEQLGEGSRRTMREALRKLADWASDGRATANTLEWHRLRNPQTVALRKRLAETLAPATANKHLAALRGVLRQCALHGSMSEADYRSAIAVPPARGPARRKRVRIGTPELARLAEACRADPSPAGARDAALVAVLSDARLRRAEAVSLQLGDFDPGTGVLSVQVTSQAAPRRSMTSPETRSALERLDLGSRTGARPPLHPRQQGRAHRRPRSVRAGDLHRLPETRRRSRPRADQSGRSPTGRPVEPASAACRAACRRRKSSAA